MSKFVYTCNILPFPPVLYVTSLFKLFGKFSKKKDSTKKRRDADQTPNILYLHASFRIMICLCMLIACIQFQHDFCTIYFSYFSFTGVVAILLLLAVSLLCAYELCAVYVTAGSHASERYSPSGFFFGVSAIALAINMLFICRMVFNGILLGHLLFYELLS